MDRLLRPAEDFEAIVGRPTKQFWDLWNMDKDAMRERGYYALKMGEKLWLAVHVKPSKRITRAI